MSVKCDGNHDSPQGDEPVREPVAWEGAEEWERLAWHLCAEENGEDACNELVWDGGPIPVPWGDRWMKYEDEARRMITLVREYAAPPAPQPEPAVDPCLDGSCDCCWTDKPQPVPSVEPVAWLEVVKAVQAWIVAQQGSGGSEPHKLNNFVRDTREDL